MNSIYDNSIEERIPLVGLVSYIIDLFDPYVSHHSHGVAYLSKKIGKCAGVPTLAQMDVLEMSARFHDIGKMALPESIRAKPGSLTPAEYFLIKHHCRMGFDILNHINGTLDSRVKLGVLYHHENFDGQAIPIN